MTAKEARELTQLHVRLANDVNEIRKVCERGGTSITLFYGTTEKASKQKMESLGYNMKDIIDDDSGYRGTTVSW